MVDKERIAYIRQQKPTGSLAKDLLHLSAVVLAMLELVWTGIEASQLTCCMPQLIMPKIYSFLSLWLSESRYFLSATWHHLPCLFCLFFSLYFSSSTFLQISFFILHVFFFSIFSFQVLWLSSYQSFCTTLRNINLILIFLLGKLKGCWDSKRKLEAILYLLLFYLVASCHVLHLVIGW